MWRSAIWITTGLSTIWAAEALAQLAATTDAPPAAPVPAVPAFSSAAPGEPAPGWRAVGLPKGKAPMTRIDLVGEPGTAAGTPARSVLRLQADRSYGNWVFDHAPWTPTRGAMLQWRWRLDQPVAGADLRQKSGDDARSRCV